MELGTILGIWAHPDDEAYLSGGLMALASAAGSRVVCVTATRGELGTPDPLAAQATQTTGLIELLGVETYTAWVGEESFVAAPPVPERL